MSFVEVQDGVELIRDSGMEVVARTLRFGPIDHSDGAFQTFGAKLRGKALVACKSHQEAGHAGLVEQVFITPSKRGTHPLGFMHPSPIGSRCYGTGVSCESNQNR